MPDAGDALRIAPPPTLEHEEPDEPELDPPGDPEEDPGGEAAETAPPEPAKKVEDPDETLEYAELSIPSEEELREALEWAFSDEDEDVPSELLDGYAKHARLVLEGNQRMNLTAIVEAREVAAKHYLDSWRATRLLPLMGRTILDLGTGAGFPGYPIAMAEPHARVCLIDSTKKRADFCQECIDTLGTKNTSAVWDRAEEHLARNRYDIVIARGISSVRENVRLLRKVRHSHKDLVMLKGPSWSREARAGEREAERLGFRMDTVWEHELPGELGKRAILVYRAPGGMGE